MGVCGTERRVHVDDARSGDLATVLVVFVVFFACGSLTRCGWAACVRVVCVQECTISIYVYVRMWAVIRLLDIPSTFSARCLPKSLGARVRFGFFVFFFLLFLLWNE